MRSAVMYLIYAAVVFRAVAYNYYDDPVPPVTYALLAAYGIVLVTEPVLSRRYPRYTSIYLILQSALVTAMMISMPAMDFIPSLFFPLCYKAVLSYGRRVGFRWIGAFILLFSIPLLYGWEWRVQGWATVIIDAAGCLDGGQLRAHLTQRSSRPALPTKGCTPGAGGVPQAAGPGRPDRGVRHPAGAQPDGARAARFGHPNDLQHEPDGANRAHAGWRRISLKWAPSSNRLQTLARSAIGEIQVLVDQLRPGPLVADSLPASLQNLAVERYPARRPAHRPAGEEVSASCRRR